MLVNGWCCVMKEQYQSLRLCYVLKDTYNQLQSFATIGTVYDFTAYDSYVKWTARIMVAVAQT